MTSEQGQDETDGKSDRDLVARFLAQHDESAFREIVRRHGPLVLGVCRRVLGEIHEAEDAFQATFLVLVRDARKIRRRKSLSCWLHRVAYRISLRIARRKFRQMDSLIDDQLDYGAGEFEHIAQRSDQRLVDEELHKLSERDRESLTMRYLQGRSNREIANALEISVSAVEGRLKRAKDRLRRQLLRRGVTLSLFLGVLAESPVDLPAIERLVSQTVQLGLLDTEGELTNSSVVHELAVTEMGEMAMSIKQVSTIAAMALLTVGLGLYGLSSHVVGQESARPLLVPPAAEQQEDIDVRLVATRSKLITGADGTGAPASVDKNASARLERAAEILATLDKDIVLEFNETPLSDIADYLKSALRVPVVIDIKALDDNGLATDVPISCSYEGISLRSALALLLEPLELDYVVRNEVLMITTEDAAETMLDPRFYATTGFDPDELVQLITSMVAESSWQEVGGPANIMSFGDGHLVISQTAQIHDQIAEFLEKLRAAAAQ